MNIKGLLLFAVFVFGSGQAAAKPAEGFGINIGGTGHSMDSTYTVGTVAHPLNSTYTYTSSGMSLGIDYQFVYTEQLTLNPFLMMSSESTDLVTQSGPVLSHGIIGFEGRFWNGSTFIGVHGAAYSETLSNSNTNNTGGTNTTITTSTGASGTGQGIVLGWEPPKSNWSVMLQADSAKIKYSDQDVNLTGARLSIGYRWK